MSKIRFKSFLELTLEEKKLVLNWRNSDTLRKNMINDHIISFEEHLRWLEKLRERNDLKYWLVYLDDKPIGVLNLQKIDYEKKQAEWGIYIGPEEMRGKGYGKLLLFALLKHYFDEMKFKTLITKVLEDNKIAINLYNKFGFKSYSNEKINNKRYILMLFTAEDWEREKERLKREAGENR
ncbi:UDP-4-amino-4,6-dideoxy-N-acetyl-beta-L-altrosamine N-acetyltransferase [Carboxydothermus pertinax]|uniref:UDP-4-amino-4,6-dideoxy-N-acetyl-beta-L-altrosamine N-acetyltransferase n=1 Tax=Carboxydothermus pertinax TaxID=870242 RepID=A0A1L8CUG1_9THEO|nr:UDP-4-amino-4,6-dideoxy-N-acetyl-beta-L-altrosamine N-acetyltransferase [Carboxydothermus pertinax]GAV22548.1 UDP-4-amino-4,6-dideoxy-N-acetyl-beta-L-altrosamine N-acetyltransferase [Carboxydothermus pertinax]